MNIFTGKYELENVTVPSPTSIFTEEWTSINPYLHTTTESSGVWFLNSSSPVQNDRHFADDIFKYIFMNEKFCI